MFKLASSVGFALALADLKQRIRRLVTKGILGAVGAVLFLIGFVFLLVALHLWISALLNPIASAGIIGGVFVLAALIFFLAASRGGTAAARPAPKEREPQASLSGVADLLGSPALRNQALLVGGLALIFGFLLGRRGKSDDEGSD